MAGGLSPGRGSWISDGRSGPVPPSRKLSAYAQKEWDRLVAFMDSRAIPDMQWIGAADRYIDAVERAEIVRREWRRSGSPLLAMANNGSEYPHPLVTLLASIERDAARFAAQLELGGKAAKRSPGGQVGAVYAPDRAAAPPKLKVLRAAS